MSPLSFVLFNSNSSYGKNKNVSFPNKKKQIFWKIVFSKRKCIRIFIKPMEKHWRTKLKALRF